jgi:hypothetical protein
LASIFLLFFFISGCRQPISHFFAFIAPMSHTLPYFEIARRRRLSFSCVIDVSRISPPPQQSFAADDAFAAAVSFAIEYFQR